MTHSGGSSTGRFALPLLSLSLSLSPSPSSSDQTYVLRLIHFTLRGLELARLVKLYDFTTLNWLVATMKGSSDYLPLDHDGSKSSTDMEDDMLIHRLRLARSHSGSYMRFLTALAALLALVIYTSIIASVTWGMAKEERRHGTRFLGCK